MDSEDEREIRKIVRQEVEKADTGLTQDQARELARESVTEVFRRFGVNPADQRQVNQFRDGVLFAAKARTGLIWFVSMVIAALVATWARVSGFFGN